MWIIPACCCCSPPFIGWRKTSSSTVLEWNKKERPQRKAASNSRFLRLLHRKKSRNQAHRIETHKNTHRSRSLLASIETNFCETWFEFWTGLATKFWVSFLWKIIDLQINDPWLGNTILFRSFQQLPRLCLEPLKGVVSAQKALNSPCALLRNYRETRIPSSVPR